VQFLGWSKYQFKELKTRFTPEIQKVVRDKDDINWFASNKYSLDRHKIRDENSMIPEMLYEIFREISYKAIALDVGANAGYWTLPLAKYFESVHAWEPDDLARTKLLKNISINPKLITKVFVHSEVVTDKIGNIDFFSIHLKDGDGLINSGLGGIYGRSLGLSPSLVSGITLDSIDFGCQKIHFIKIDVEGAESKVLLGACSLIRSNLPIIFWESSFGLDKNNKTRNVLSSFSILQSFEYFHYALMQDGSITLVNSDFFRDQTNLDCDILSVPQNFPKIQKIASKYLTR